MLRAKNLEDINIGDKILMELINNGLMILEIEDVNIEENSVKCKDNPYIDFYPNDDNQFIIIE